MSGVNIQPPVNVDAAINVDTAGINADGTDFVGIAANFYRLKNPQYTVYSLGATSNVTLPDYVRPASAETLLQDAATNVVAPVGNADFTANFVTVAGFYRRRSHHFMLTVKQDTHYVLTDLQTRQLTTVAVDQLLNQYENTGTAISE